MTSLSLELRVPFDISRTLLDETKRPKSDQPLKTLVREPVLGALRLVNPVPLTSR
jgi:hypothetical protein